MSFKVGQFVKIEDGSTHIIEERVEKVGGEVLYLVNYAIVSDEYLKRHNPGWVRRLLSRLRRRN